MIRAHAPTEVADDSEKNEFYDQLQQVRDVIPSCDTRILIGNLITQISSGQVGHDKIIAPMEEQVTTTAQRD